jgi:CubicO group peptidase (beta-lactamase class C family)
MPRALDTFLDWQLAGGHCPGALVHVERAGQVLARQAVGQVRPGSPAPMHDGVRFRIASLTKPVVTLAALMLVDEGRLALDAPVGEVLPELRDLRLGDGRPPRCAPTVRDLMRHTSGLAYPFEVPAAALRERWLAAGFTPALAGLDAPAFLARLASLPLVAEPGTVFRYGYSTDVLGCIVERLDDATLGQALQRRLFGPLGMAHTGFEIAPDTPADLLASALPEDQGWHAHMPPIGRRTPGQPWMDSGGGGLVSTLDDCVAFARLLADGGQCGAQRLLPQALMAELGRNQLPDGVDGPAAYCGPGFGFGLGLAVRLGAGPAAMACTEGELVWSGISGTALFVQPRERWFALLLSANMASRMVSRMALRHALARA